MTEGEQEHPRQPGIDNPRPAVTRSLLERIKVASVKKVPLVDEVVSEDAEAEEVAVEGGREGPDRPQGDHNHIEPSQPPPEQPPPMKRDRPW